MQYSHFSNYHRRGFSTLSIFISVLAERCFILCAAIFKLIKRRDVGVGEGQIRGGWIREEGLEGKV
jgi:hypothetical protein